VVRPLEQTDRDDRTGQPPGEPGRTLWLVRHGESTWNARGLIQGQRSEPRLTRRGVAQARGVARRLGGRSVCALYSSDLLRAVETARPVAAAVGLSPVADRRLRERALGSAEGMPSSWLAPAESGLVDGSVVDPDAAPPGGESVRQLRRRVGEFLDELADDLRLGPPGDVVLVVHGGVVGAALAHLDGVPVEEMAWGPVGNGEALRRTLTASRRPLPGADLPDVAPRDATPFSVP
jgi:probable phosphoglycerate mutase